MLDIKNLQVQVEGKQILKGIDLHVDAGEVHANCRCVASISRSTRVGSRASKYRPGTRPSTR